MPKLEMANGEERWNGVSVEERMEEYRKRVEEMGISLDVCSLIAGAFSVINGFRGRVISSLCSVRLSQCSEPSAGGGLSDCRDRARDYWSPLTIRFKVTLSRTILGF